MSCTCRNLSDALNAISTITVDEDEDDLKRWSMRVLRQDLANTTMENLEEAEDDDWKLPLRVTFIGEEGVDAGGLTRELFTLFFRETPLIDRNTFSLKPEYLDKRYYYILGRFVAKALLTGHPGPRCFSNAVAKYVTLAQEPDVMQDIQDDDLPAGAAHAIQQVC